MTNYRLYSTAVEGGYSFFEDMLERMTFINVNQVLSHFFNGRYKDEDLIEFSLQLKSYHGRFLAEKWAIKRFAETYNSEFATDNNECFSVVETMLRKLKMTLKGAMQIFKEFCAKKRHRKYDGAGKPLKLSVLTHSDLGARYTQLVIPFSEEEAIPKYLMDLCNLLMEYFIDIMDVIGICDEVMREELKILRDYPRLVRIFNDSVAALEELLELTLDCEGCPDTIDKIADPMTQELLRTEESRWGEEVLPKYFHKRNKRQLMTFIRTYRAYTAKHGLVPTQLETDLWMDDTDKIEKVRFFLKHIDDLDYEMKKKLGVQGQMDGNTGRRKLNGRFVAMFACWALAGVEDKGKKMKKFVEDYFNREYKGQYQTIVYTTVNGAYKQIIDKDKAIDEMGRTLYKIMNEGKIEKRA